MARNNNYIRHIIGYRTHLSKSSSSNQKTKDKRDRHPPKITLLLHMANSVVLRGHCRPNSPITITLTLTLTTTSTKTNTTPQ